MTIPDHPKNLSPWINVSLRNSPIGNTRLSLKPVTVGKPVTEALLIQVFLWHYSVSPPGKDMLQKQTVRAGSTRSGGPRLWTDRSGDAAEILCLRRLGVWGKSVAHMRECPRPLVEVGIELSGMEPVCVVT